MKSQRVRLEGRPSQALTLLFCGKVSAFLTSRARGLSPTMMVSGCSKAFPPSLQGSGTRAPTVPANTHFHSLESGLPTGERPSLQPLALASSHHRGRASRGWCSGSGRSGGSSKSSHLPPKASSPRQWPGHDPAGAARPSSHLKVNSEDRIFRAFAPRMC